MTVKEIIKDAAGGSLGEVDDEVVDTEETSVDSEAESQDDTPDSVDSDDIGVLEVEDNTSNTADDEKPYFWEVPYMANGEERKIKIGVNSKGELLPETIEDLKQTYAKTGLESVAQQAREREKSAQREANAERIARQQMAQEKAAVEREYEALIAKTRQDPVAVQSFNRRGIQLPDVEAIRQKRELEALRQEKLMRNSAEAIADYEQSLRSEHSYLTDEQIVLLDQTMTTNGSYDLLKGRDLDSRTKVIFLNMARTTISDLILNGKLPNPQTEKLKQERDAATKELNKEKKRRVPKNPMVGGFGGTPAGKAKQNWTWADVHDGKISQSEFIAWQLRHNK